MKETRVMGISFWKIPALLCILYSSVLTYVTVGIGMSVAGMAHDRHISFHNNEKRKVGGSSLFL